MTKSSHDFSLKVDGVNELCPSGEAWAEKNLNAGVIYDTELCSSCFV